jgi:FMN phosphatase YigB (HAD superfamily)
MIPSVVVFDLGKVLVDFDYQLVSDRIAARGKLGAAAIRKLLDHSPLLFRLETGFISNEEFYQEVVNATGYDGSLDEFATDFGDIFTEIPEMTAFNAALRANGIPTHIFSNTNEMAARHIRRTFPFFKNFTGYVYSYQHKSMKPSARLYEVVEETTGCRGPSILYLDDKPENVAAGAARGWQAWVHQTPAETLAAAKALGLPTPNK